MAEPVRLRLVALLASTRERACVCELCDALVKPQYAISRHLIALEAVGLVSGMRSGRWMYYRYTPPSGQLGTQLTGLLTALRGREFWADRNRFQARIVLRRRGRCVVWRLPPAS